jgi:processive 1,2-diacylglycerol beta-glucosyltransferase
MTVGRQRALVLTGNLGMGHHVITEIVVGSLDRLGWSTEVLDCMSLLGRLPSKVGDWVFRRLTATPTLYDGIHFSHFRPGGGLASAVDWGATSRLVPVLDRHLQDHPVDLLASTFATGSSAIAKLTAVKRTYERPATVALCTDVSPHRLWVWEGLDLFMVTSPAAAAAVRRYAPRAPIAVVPPPVRHAFHEAPSQHDARVALGIDPSARCALVMGGGWGLGPLATTARALADEGVVVLVVAGRNPKLAQALAEEASRQPLVVPFGFTDQIPTLMAAADLVVTTPGATTCSEARVVRRPLMLLDVIPGHGRDNIQHELELGDADVCDPDPARLVDSVLFALQRSVPPVSDQRVADRWDERFAEALAVVGIVPAEQLHSPTTAKSTPLVTTPEETH